MGCFTEGFSEGFLLKRTVPPVCSRFYFIVFTKRVLYEDYFSGEICHILPYFTVYSWTVDDIIYIDGSLAFL